MVRRKKNPVNSAVESNLNMAKRWIDHDEKILNRDFPGSPSDYPSIARGLREQRDVIRRMRLVLTALRKGTREGLETYMRHVGPIQEWLRYYGGESSTGTLLNTAWDYVERAWSHLFTEIGGKMPSPKAAGRIR